MEVLSPPEYPAIIGCDDGRHAVGDGVGVDDKWKHRQVCEIGSHRGSIGTCMPSV